MQRDEPAYPVGEAARYLRLSPATLRSWFVGRPYPTSRGMTRFEPVFQPAQKEPPILSFSNLIEAHVLRALRTEHGVPLDAVRSALSYAQHELEIEHLLLRRELRTSGGDLFLERYGQLINLSASGQLAMRRVFDAHLERVDWGAKGAAIRLHPFLMAGTTDARRIVIDPEIAFGRPVVGAAFISTRAILERIDAGERIEDVAADYELDVQAIEEAILFERAA